jgi:hypothetical protein
MGWSYVDSAYSHSTVSNTCTPAKTISVSVGDLIVIMSGAFNATIYSDDAYDDMSNSYTHRTVLDNNTTHLLTSYSVATNAGTTTFTAHYTGSSGYWGWIMVAVFRPDAGDTVSFDVGGTKLLVWGSGTQTTTTADTTGDDEVIIAGVVDQNGVGFSNREIPSGTAATNLALSTWNNIFYRIATATIANCCAEVDFGGNTESIIEFVAFKATAGGGGGGVSLQKMSSYYYRKRSS